MRKFNICVMDSDLDVLARACRYGMSCVSRVEIRNGEAANIERRLKRILAQIEKKQGKQKKE